jgi:hypothetical protein
MNTKDKGDEAELSVLLFLKQHGYSMSIPFGENAPYDLVAESPTRKIYRVQVRWSTWAGNVLKVRLRSSSKNYYRTIDRTRIDVFAVWDGEMPYFLSTAETMDNVNELWLRKEKAKNGQTKGIRLIADCKDVKLVMP